MEKDFGILIGQLATSILEALTPLRSGGLQVHLREWESRAGGKEDDGLGWPMVPQIITAVYCPSMGSKGVD